MSNSDSVQTGQHVQWSWDSGTGTGQIDERFERSVTRTLQGSELEAENK